MHACVERTNKTIRLDVRIGLLNRPSVLLNVLADLWVPIWYEHIKAKNERFLKLTKSDKRSSYRFLKLLVNKTTTVPDMRPTTQPRIIANAIPAGIFDT
jgi:hypothetical protein